MDRIRLYWDMTHPGSGMTSEVRLKEKRLYQEEPDYQRALIHLGKPQLKRLYEGLFEIYGRLQATEILDELIRIIEVHGAHRSPEAPAQDPDPSRSGFPASVILMLSGKLLSARGHRKQQLLQQLKRLQDGQPGGIYLDDLEVGTGGEVLRKAWGVVLEAKISPIPLRLEAGIFARVSCHEDWFKEYLNGHPGYRDFFQAFASLPHSQERTPDNDRCEKDNTAVTRFHSHAGTRWVLTDLSGLKAGLNFTNPRVLLAVFDRLLRQVRQGTQWIDLGEVELHALPEGSKSRLLLLTTKVLGLLARGLHIAAPEAGLLITPGDSVGSWLRLVEKKRQRQLIRDPNLLPLVLWSMLSGEAFYLIRWLEKRRAYSKEVLFFNDPQRHPRLTLESGCEVLPLQERRLLYDWVRSRGGEPDSEGSSDEMQVEWLDVFCPYGADLQWGQRLLASRSIFLALDGVSGVFPEEWPSPSGEGEELGRALVRMVSARLTEAAFQPVAKMDPLTLHPNVCSLIRWAEDGRTACLCLTNLLGTEVEFELDAGIHGLWEGRWQALLSGEEWVVKGRTVVVLTPYEVRWYRLAGMAKEEETRHER